MAVYDWIIGIALPIMIALIFFLLDKQNSGLVIFVFLNIGFALMVYGGLIELWILVLNLIFTIILVYIRIKTGGSVSG